MIRVLFELVKVFVMKFFIRDCCSLFWVCIGV